MLVLDNIKRMYTIDTLDARFISSRQTSVDPTSTSARSRTTVSRSSERKASSSQQADRPLPGTNASRWRSPEYIFYVIAFFSALSWMFKVAFDVSKPTQSEYPKYSHLLSPGWLAGRKVDNSDPQYRLFRDNLPYLISLLVLHPVLRRVYEYIAPLSQHEAAQRLLSSSGGSPHPPSIFRPAAVADERLARRVWFDLRFGLLFLCALHGFSALKIMVILYLNFTLCTRLPKGQIPVATWVFNIGMLFANELCSGYKYAQIAQLTTSWLASSGVGPSGTWGTWLDSYGGLIARWEILFNITVLRLISFNLDYYWSLQTREGSAIEKKQLDPANLSDKDRVSVSAKPDDYSFRNYVAYALYAPLYLAGPLITFNDFTHQLRYRAPSITLNRTLLYSIRFLLCLFTMEFLLHFVYAVAICKAQPVWEVYTPFQVSMIGYFNLHIIWLKLLLPWRFFRTWSLIDGIDPPENVVRCMSDNFSMLSFWRGWHRSFNQWIVRYIYVPLGGSARPGERRDTFWAKARATINLVAVFTFVALWHDINLRLLAWGWLVVLFVLPEFIGKWIFPKRKWESRPVAYRLLTGAGCVFNVLSLMVANLVGFAVGIDGFFDLIHGVVGSFRGILFIPMACACIFVAVQLMFEIREHEARKGVNLKC